MRGKYVLEEVKTKEGDTVFGIYREIRQRIGAMYSDREQAKKALGRLTVIERKDIAESGTAHDQEYEGEWNDRSPKIFPQQ